MDDFRGEMIHASSYKDAADAARSQGARGRRRQHRLRHRGRGRAARRRVLALRSAAATGTRRSSCSVARPTRSTTRSRPNTCRCGCGSGCSHGCCGLTVGDLTRYGLPKPDHRVYETHPIVNSQLLYYDRPRRRTPVAGGRSGSTATASCWPTASRSTRTWSSSRPATCRGSSSSGRTCSTRTRKGGRSCALHTFARRYPTLAVAGMVQPDSGVFPIVHWQTVTIARWLRLREADPRRAAEFWQGIVANSRPPLDGCPGQGLDPALVRDQPHRLSAGAAARLLGDLEAAR